MDARIKRADNANFEASRLSLPFSRYEPEMAPIVYSVNLYLWTILKDGQWSLYCRYSIFVEPSLKRCYELSLATSILGYLGRKYDLLQATRRIERVAPRFQEDVQAVGPRAVNGSCLQSDGR